MVRALADVTVESASLDAREALSRNVRSRPQRDQAVDPADRDDEPLPVRRAVRSATVLGHGWVDAALGSGHVRSLVEELQSRPSGGCHCVAYSASTMNGLPFSTTYVASSAAVPLPTFLTEWTVSAGTIKASPALYVFGGWPSMEYSSIPFST